MSIKYLNDEKDVYNDVLNTLQPELDSLEDIYQKIFSDESIKTVTGNGINIEVRDKLVKEMTNFSTYNEFYNYLTTLRNDVSLLKLAINRCDELADNASYRYLLLFDEYQNYEVKEIDLNSIVSCINFNNVDAWGVPLEPSISYSKYCELYGNVSPYDFYLTVKNNYPDCSITGLSNIDLMGSLFLTKDINFDLGKMYNYIYDTQGIDAANEYLSKMQNEINGVAGQARALEFINTLEDNPDNFEYVLNHLNTLLKGTIDGGESFFEGIYDWFSGSDVRSVNEYEAFYILQYLQENDNKGKYLNYTYEFGEMLGFEGTGVAIALLTNGTVGSIAMGISTGGLAYHDALVDGYSTDKSVIYGVVMGGSELLLERLFGVGNVTKDVFGRTSILNVRDFVQRVVYNGIEEGTQEYVEALAQYNILNKDIDWNEVSEESFKSTIYGLLVGGVVNLPLLANYYLTSPNIY